MPISRDEAREALRLARAKYTASPGVEATGREKGPYTPPGPGCTPAPGIPPTTCGAYVEASAWLPPAFVQNATCACESTPDSPSANAVRKTLQDELASTPEAFRQACKEALARRPTNPLLHPEEAAEYDLWVAEFFAPVAYEWHVRAYQSGCCPCGPAPFVDWVAVCTIPIPFCKLVEEAIDWFGSCHCTPGRW